MSSRKTCMTCRKTCMTAGRTCMTSRKTCMSSRKMCMPSRWFPRKLTYQSIYPVSFHDRGFVLIYTCACPCFQSQRKATTRQDKDKTKTKTLRDERQTHAIQRKVVMYAPMVLLLLVAHDRIARKGTTHQAHKVLP